MKCRVLTVARLHVAQVAKWRVAFLTLTYAPAQQWDRRHISDCLRFVRTWLKSRGIRLRYVWVAEMQKRGVVHYHVVLWLPLGMKLPFLDDRGWWPHGMTQMQWARNAVGYVAKYATKGDSGPRLPKGARMYGVGGLTDVALDEACWWARPTWLRAQVRLGASLRPLQGGGWVDRDSGEIYASPWTVIFRGGFVFLRRAAA